MLLPDLSRLSLGHAHAEADVGMNSAARVAKEGALVRWRRRAAQRDLKLATTNGCKRRRCNDLDAAAKRRHEARSAVDAEYTAARNDAIKHQDDIQIRIKNLYKLRKSQTDKHSSLRDDLRSAFAQQRRESREYLEQLLDVLEQIRATELRIIEDRYLHERWLAQEQNDQE